MQNRLSYSSQTPIFPASYFSKKIAGKIGAALGKTKMHFSRMHSSMTLYRKARDFCIVAAHHLGDVSQQILFSLQ